MRVVVAAGVAAALACGRGAPQTSAPQTSAAQTSAPQTSAPQTSATRSPRASSAPSLPTESEIRERDIDFYSARARRDPSGAADLAHVAALYLQRSRETGDLADAERAERAARRSYANRAAHNAQALQVLASSLLAQHRFAAALGAARALRATDPEDAEFRATVGEIQMELGQYDSARATFAALAGSADDLAVAPRLARWAEVEGRTSDARRVLWRSTARAARTDGMPREQLAWFWLRTGDVELRAGQPAAAEEAFRSGLRVHPDDFRLLAAMAHLAAVRQQWTDAVRYGERAVAANLDPATLGTLSDAYAALGDTARSLAYARTLDVAVLREPGAYHRAWSLFLLDHDRHVAAVSRKVREELRTRRDVYGYDLLAWSLHKQGRHAAAARAIATALRQGTRDAQLLFHAGMIERALGHDDAARRYLSDALSVNPYFHPTQAGVARAALAALSPAPRELRSKAFAD